MLKVSKLARSLDLRVKLEVQARVRELKRERSLGEVQEKVPSSTKQMDSKHEHLLGVWEVPEKGLLPMTQMASRHGHLPGALVKRRLQATMMGSKLGRSKCARKAKVAASTIEQERKPRELWRIQRSWATSLRSNNP